MAVVIVALVAFYYVKKRYQTKNKKEGTIDLALKVVLIITLVVLLLKVSGFELADYITKEQTDLLVAFGVVLVVAFFAWRAYLQYLARPRSMRECWVIANKFMEENYDVAFRGVRRKDTEALSYTESLPSITWTYERVGESESNVYYFLFKEVSQKRFNVLLAVTANRLRGDVINHEVSASPRKVRTIYHKAGSLPEDITTRRAVVKQAGLAEEKEEQPESNGGVGNGE